MQLSALDQEESLGSATQYRSEVDHHTSNDATEDATMEIMTSKRKSERKRPSPKALKDLESEATIPLEKKKAPIASPVVQQKRRTVKEEIKKETKAKKIKSPTSIVPIQASSMTRTR